MFASPEDERTKPAQGPAKAVSPEFAHGFAALVFSRTTGFRHDSIETGIQAIQALATEHDFDVTATEDPAVFTDSGLAPFDVVIFLNTTGDVLNGAQQSALERFIAAGNGFVGVHSAADTEYNWPWYGGLVGAWFASHPAIQQATVQVMDRVHPSSAGLSERWVRTDEWYDFRSNPRDSVHVLATMDTDTYSGHTMGHDHPIAWCRPYQGGRSWYTGMGHTRETYAEPDFREHLVNGIEWAAGVIEGDCSATIGASFDYEILERTVDSPMDLAVLPDGSVLFTELEGALRLYDASTRTTQTVNTFSVFRQSEDGLLGIELDPDFETNSWVYLFYSPSGSEAKQHVSRFTWTGAALDMSSEVVLLEIPTQRQECCHSGGSLEFGPDGSLFIATGDNTNPFASDGYAPIDEQPGREPWDAQRSSGNTQDLRGKVLRIVPQTDGTYTIPEGNLFEDPADGLPEIYVMGARNPFRISVDPATGWLYFGEVGPDARADNASLGPRGFDEWNQVRAAGNYGWPFCSGPNLPYGDRDFATGIVSGTFDCSAPRNTSVNNTGAELLPPAQPAWIWYPYDTSSEFPGIPDGGGRTAMAGPVFQYDESRVGEGGLPAYFQDRVLLYEWSRSYILVASLDADGDLLALDRLPGERDLRQPISMEQGPDGALYLLEWGTGFGTGNDDARLSRISFTGGERKPVARLAADPQSGPVPLEVSFSAAGSFDPDGDPLTYAWDFDGDGSADANTAEGTFTYTTPGDYLARLTVTDSNGNLTEATITITAGNTRPVLEVDNPVDRGLVAWGATVPFRVTVSDAEDGSSEDGSIDCSNVEVLLFLGHDAHTHPLGTTSGCEGELRLAPGHGDSGDKLFHVIEFRYTDGGAGSAGPITVTEERVLLPTLVEAEHYDAENGIQTETTSDVLGGGINIGWIDHGDWIRFDEMDLTALDFVTFRVASAGTGGWLRMRRGELDGPIVAEVYVVPTGGWQEWRDLIVPLNDVSQEGPLYLEFSNSVGDSGLFNINYLKFHGAGLGDAPDVPEGLEAVYLARSGQSRLERQEPGVAFDWRDGGPVFGAPPFTSTWIGTFDPPSDGVYTVHLRTQGTADVSLGGIVVADLDSPGSERVTRSRGTRLNPSQPVDVVVTYASGTGRSALWVEMEGPGVPRQTLGGGLTTPGSSVSSAAGPELPASLEVSAAYPNPTSDRAKLELLIPSPEPVDIVVHDLLGREVQRHRYETVRPGAWRSELDLRGLAAGVYQVVIRQGAFWRSQAVLKVR